jgi:EmrB/QacA subfamily drug resistance transporter
MAFIPAAPEVPPDAGRARKWTVLVAVGIGTFMSALDGSIVNTVLPTMREALGASVAAVEWVISIYLLVVSGVLLGFGRLGDLRGYRGVYLTGFAGFVATSALCGLAPSTGWLVAARALQALAAAMLFSTGPAILTRAFPPTERGRALGLQATMTYLGLSAGPPLGGLLAARFGWRAIFFVNVPVGLLGLLLARARVPRDAPLREVPPFDFSGAALFFAGLSGLLVALDEGHEWGWVSPPILGLFALAAVLLLAFGALERRRPHPMLDLSLFRSSAFAGSAFGAVASYVGEYAVLFLCPFYLVQARGLPVERAGALLAALPVLMMVTAPFSGTLSDRLGSRGLTSAGLVLLTAGLVLLSLAGSGAPLWRVAVALAVCGLGLGVFIAPNNSRMLGAAPPNRRGIASGVLAAARNVGMVLGVGLAGAVYTTVLARTGPAGVSQAASAGFLAAAAVTGIAAMTSWLEGEGAGP